MSRRTLLAVVGGLAVTGVLQVPAQAAAPAPECLADLRVTA